jgi:hypothetical protein
VDEELHESFIKPINLPGGPENQPEKSPSTKKPEPDNINGNVNDK